MAPSPYFDYVPYRDGNISKEMSDLADVMEQNDFKIHHIRNWLQNTELPQNDITHEQINRAFSDTELMGRILEIEMGVHLKLTHEALLYKELLHHKDWQFMQLMQLDLELMRLSSGYFSGPVMAVSTTIDGLANDTGDISPVSAPVNLSAEHPVVPNPSAIEEHILDPALENIPEVVTDSIPDHMPLYVPEYAPYPMLDCNPDFALEDLAGVTSEPIQAYTEYFPGDIDMLEYSGLNYIPDHAVGEILEYGLDQAPDYIYDGQVAGDIPEAALVPTPTLAPSPEHSAFSPASCQNPLQQPKDAPMPDPVGILEPVTESSTMPELVPAPAPTVNPALVVVRKPVRKGGVRKSSNTKHKLVKPGRGYARKLPPTGKHIGSR
ncbi:uncharacterized protein GGS22DRAFT_191819 [Annulohypoxylon maeteangense]|uniref:uncharacterized protein n=1 Tax=Annulohypoxylon maeteangense TaxID=1927788 RepID=UPI002007EC55|nr:uncharacterized protein GGS22DRAFT_191819 [Annulohypoxylon maeteangense]KAI0882088.1 hypothetical protein GGS22DRAFT_191819 [Annulohypoxylon maeteangense]